MDDDRYYELFPQTLLAGQASYQEQGRRSRNYARNSDECEIVGYQGSFKTIGVGGSLTGEPVDMLWTTCTKMLPQLGRLSLDRTWPTGTIR